MLLCIYDIFKDIIIPLVGIMASLSVSIVAITISLKTKKHQIQFNKEHSRISLHSKRNEIWSQTKAVSSFLQAYSTFSSADKTLKSLVEFLSKMDYEDRRSYYDELTKRMKESESVLSNICGLFDENVYSFIFNFNNSFVYLSLFIIHLINFDFNVSLDLMPEYPDMRKFYDYLIKSGDIQNSESELNKIDAIVQKKYLNITQLGAEK